MDIYDCDLDDIRFILDYIRFTFAEKDLMRIAVVIVGMDKVVALKALARERNITYERYIDASFFQIGLSGLRIGLMMLKILIKEPSTNL